MKKNSFTKEMYRKKYHLNLNERKSINQDFKRGLWVHELKKKYNCVNSTIYRWINDKMLHKSINGIRKKRICKPYKSRKSGKDRKNHAYKKNKDKYHHLKEKMISLYKELGSAAKVSKALTEDFNVKLSREAVLRRIPQELRSKNRKNKKIPIKNK